MRKIAHIINPVIVNPPSDLFIAQPITFESMRIAQENAMNCVDVELLSAQFEEDVEFVPSFFNKTPNLNRSVLEFGSFKKKLPLLKDILDRMYQNSDAEYLIYTNVDIALKPNFYIEVNNLIKKGYDAFVINRRTISSKFKSVEELPLMHNELGKKHPGYDCFVFKRDLYQNLKLGRVMIGANWIGWTLLTNLISYSNKIRIFENLHLTFHIGEERVLRNKIYDDYSQFNYNEYLSIANAITLETGKFSKFKKHYKALKIPKFLFILKYL